MKRVDTSKIVGDCSLYIKTYDPLQSRLQGMVKALTFTNRACSRVY